MDSSALCLIGHFVPVTASLALLCPTAVLPARRRCLDVPMMPFAAAAAALRTGHLSEQKEGGQPSTMTPVYWPYYAASPCQNAGYKAAWKFMWRQEFCRESEQGCYRLCRLSNLQGTGCARGTSGCRIGSAAHRMCWKTGTGLVQDICRLSHAKMQVFKLQVVHRECSVQLYFFLSSHRVCRENRNSFCAGKITEFAVGHHKVCCKALYAGMQLLNCRARVVHRVQVYFLQHTTG